MQLGTLTAAIPKIKSKSTAPGQYLGYGLQDVRLCHHLLKTPPGTSVSLEFVDDTAIHYSDGKLLLEQSKSALKGNPVSDGSPELWKTFANWSNLCVDRQVSPSTTKFRLYVCPLKDANLAQLMHAATTDAEATALLKKITKKVTAKNSDKGCSPSITEFIGAGKDICCQIILNFELVGDVDPLEPIREILRLAVQDQTLDDFCAHAIGTAKNQIAVLIRAGSSPIIDTTIFRKQLQAFIRKHGILNLLAPTIEIPADAAIKEIVESAPIFVQQLLKIQISHEYLIRAVSDYLRSEADHTTWAAEGRIVEESLYEFNDTLERHFEITRSEIEDLHSASDEVTRGQRVYRKCISHQTSLEGHVVPNYFIPGSFNLLANFGRIGWHPKYSDFFVD
ncbi:ABC-three component system protein [Methylobacterium sp. Leaf87]|uniref:ABC-three component system protein n=1 Tax=Methylobacterium sp. Leaf87 TaxID=1736243 RepID=UPI000B0AB50A|nr:ABC-three component system protein [Methylobacterium sp. Leaf87]